MRKFITCSLAAATLFMMTACGSMTETGKGTLIGAGGGAGLGALIGGLIGGGKGTAIGASIGAAVGAGTGAAIGHSMQKKREKLEQEMAEQATVETITDANGLTAIKITFDADMTFPKNGTTLKSKAKDAVKKFAASMQTEDMINTAIQIKGHTDSSGTLEVNERISAARAKAVGDILRGNGIAYNRVSEFGCAYHEPITGNAADAANRRVEVYVLATEAMVQQYSQD